MDGIAIFVFYRKVFFYLSAPIFDDLPFYTKHTCTPGSGGTVEDVSIKIEKFVCYICKLNLIVDSSMHHLI